MIMPPVNFAEIIGFPGGGNASVPEPAMQDFAAILTAAAVAPDVDAAVPPAAQSPDTIVPIISAAPLAAIFETAAVMPHPAKLMLPQGMVLATGIQTNQVPAPVVQGTIAAEWAESLAFEAEANSAMSASHIGSIVPFPVTFLPKFDHPSVPDPVTTDLEPSISGPARAAKPVPMQIGNRAVALPQIATAVVAAPTIAAPFERASSSTLERNEPPLAQGYDMRSSTSAPTADRVILPLPDRGATFAPMIADAVHDLVAMAKNDDVRFSVRPETLGRIAVTIERTDAGPTLRLGVETQAAVQAVRSAEPTMNDARGAAPFAQVTVDMAAPDSRGRSPRPAPVRHAFEEQVLELLQRQQPVSTGRFA